MEKWRDGENGVVSEGRESKGEMVGKRGERNEGRKEKELQ